MNSGCAAALDWLLDFWFVAIRAANRLPCPPPLPTLVFAPDFGVYTEFGIDSVDADVVYTSALLADAMKPLNMLSKI